MQFFRPARIGKHTNLQGIAEQPSRYGYGGRHGKHRLSGLTVIACFAGSNDLASGADFTGSSGLAASTGLPISSVRTGLPAFTGNLAKSWLAGSVFGLTDKGCAGATTGGRITSGGGGKPRLTPDLSTGGAEDSGSAATLFSLVLQVLAQPVLLAASALSWRPEQARRIGARYWNLPRSKY